MATLFCDNTERHQAAEAPEPAAWLVSRLQDGESLAWCDPCYLELCMLVAAQAVEQLPDQEPEPAPQPDQDDEDQEDTEALARLEGLGRARTAAAAPNGSGPTATPSEAPGPAESALEAVLDVDQAQQDGAQEPAPEPASPAQVVKRGTSRSRRAHEGRKRQRAAARKGDSDNAQS